MAGLAAALEEHRIAALEGQGADLHQRVGPRLKDHAQHPQGAGLPGELQACIQLPAQVHPAQGLGQGRHGPHAGGHLLQLGGAEAQALEGGGADGALRSGQVQGIGRQDGLGVGQEARGQRFQHTIASGARADRQGVGGGPGGHGLPSDGMFGGLFGGGLGVGAEQGAHGLARQDALQDAGLQARGQHHGHAALGGQAGGAHLAGHAAAAPATATCQVHVQRGAEGHLPHGRGTGVQGRVAGVEGRHIRQQHQQVRIQVHGHQGREVVVVAEDRRAPLRGPLQLQGGHRVVLVEHGHRIHGQEGFQGALEVGVAGGVREVVFREQHLGGGEAQAPQAVGVEGHQLALAHGGAGLLVRQGTGLEAQAAGPQAHRTGGHQQGLAAPGAHGSHGLHEPVEPAQGGAPLGVHHHLGAQLHDDAPRRTEVAPGLDGVPALRRCCGWSLAGHGYLK